MVVFKEFAKYGHVNFYIKIKTLFPYFDIC